MLCCEQPKPVPDEYKTRHMLCCERPEQFLMDLRHAHLVAKHAVRYLKGTIEYGLKYDRIKRLTCMVMLIRIGSATEKKSTLGCFFGLRFSIGYWFGRIQSCMALSTAEEKYVATYSTICEVVCFF